MRISVLQIITRIMIPAIAILFGMQAYGQNQTNAGKDYVLLITSYAHDSHHVTHIINDLDSATLDLGIELDTKIESLIVRSLNDCYEWHNVMKNILRRHNTSELKGIILHGQESWATFLSLDTVPKVPFYGCKITDSGVDIPDSAFNSIEWNPKCISTREKAQYRKCAGAIMQEFDIIGTMQMVMRLYPNISNVAILTDNSYGGISLLAKFRVVMGNCFGQMRSYELDTRKYTVQEIKNKVDSLPKNTVLLLGTWRVGKNANFFMQKTINKLVENRPDLPIFTPTMPDEELAIGGRVPNFRNCYRDYLESVLPQMVNGTTDTLYVKVGNHYSANASRMEDYRLDPKMLPKGTIVKESHDSEAEKYQQRLTISIIISAALIAIISVVINLLQKVRWQNQQLNAQKLELKRSEEMAKRSDKLKSTFLLNLSHEINTPANGLLGFINIMEEKLPGYDAEFSREIKDSAYRLLDIINKVVEFSKLDSGMLEFDIEEFNLSQVVQQVRDKFEHTCAAKGLEINTTLPNNECLVIWDKGKTSRMISILTENAIKFTHKGSINIGFFADTNRFTVFVQDTGIGICEENQARIFEKFEKLDSFTEGTGLGLAYIKAIAEKAGGNAKVISKPDYGSRFIIEIPCKICTPQNQGQNSEMIAEIYDANTLMKDELNSQFKILVAEDSDVNFLLIKQLLSNHNLKRVSTGQEAIEAIRNDWYDLVLMDIKMPNMDGLEATRNIRKFDPQIPVIALTAFSMDTNLAMAKRAGCNNLLFKPITRKKLYDAILALM